MGAGSKAVSALQMEAHALLAGIMPVALTTKLEQEGMTAPAAAAPLPVPADVSSSKQVQVEEYMEGSSTSNWIHVPESPCRAAKERRKATMRTW